MHKRKLLSLSEDVRESFGSTVEQGVMSVSFFNNHNIHSCGVKIIHQGSWLCLEDKSLRKYC